MIIKVFLEILKLDALLSIRLKNFIESISIFHPFCEKWYIVIYLTRQHITLKELSNLLFLSTDLFMRMIIEYFSLISLSIYLTITTVVLINERTMPYAVYEINL